METRFRKSRKIRRLSLKALALAMAFTITSTAGTAVFAADSSSSNSSTTQSTQQGPGGGGTPPEKPSGDSGSGQTPPDMPSGGGDGQAPDGNGGGPGGGGGADTQTFDYTGDYTGALTADGEEKTSDGETYDADTADQNAALSENGGTLTVTNGTFTKSGDDTNGDNCNFYGLNSIFLTVGTKSKSYVSDSTLSSSSEGSNGIFATDNGTVYAYNDSISTTAGNSRGLDATYGGTIIADSMGIETQGDHCAALATDRGGGNISVTNSTLSTAGSGSPLLYSTGDIEVNNVTGTSSGSQIAGMEGLNTIIIRNSNLTSTVTDKTASDPIADGVIIYQSTSGDAESTTGDAATFQAVDSTLSSSIESGAMFYVTNTTANMLLKGTTLNFDSDKANLLTIAGNDSNGWGTAGSNGGTVTLTASDEELKGNISVDTISSLDLYLTDGTTYTGAMTIEDNSSATDTTDSPITVNVDSTSKWVVTGDTTISALNVEDGGQVVDENGDTVTIVANGETVVQGTGDVTVTVTGNYSTTLGDNVTAEDTDYIDRSDFDSYYNLSTSFTSADTNTADASGTGETASAADTAGSAQTTSSGSHAGPIAAGIVIAAAAVGGIAYGVNRKKKKGEKDSEK